jgi:aminobenzoyl-glutamate utilization protein B
MSIGDKASLATAKIMAGLGFDVLTDPELRKAAKEDLVRRTGGKPFVSPLPKEQTGPIGLPPELRKTGEDDFVSPLRTLV